MNVPPCFETVQDEVDAVLDVLANRSRRLVIGALVAREEPMSLVDLADEIRPSSTAPTTPLDTRDLMIRLHHVHLPMMDEAGAVSYDATGQNVALTPFGRRIAAVNDAVVTRLG